MSRLRMWWTRQVVIFMVRLGWKADLVEQQERLTRKLDELEQLIDDRLSAKRERMTDDLG